MPTNYPGSLDNLPRPSASTQMNASGYEGASVIDNISDAVEAIETELGVDPAGGAATVKDRLDYSVAMGARHPAWGTSAHYFYPGFVADGYEGTGAVSANRLYFHPFWCPTTVTLSAVVCRVASGATGNVRMGVYGSTVSSGKLVPGSLLVDAGTSSTAASGYKEIATTQQLLGDTLYWLAMVLDAAITMGRWAESETAGGSMRSTGGTRYVAGWDQAHTYGALPGSASSLGTVSAWYQMWVKL